MITDADKIERIRSWLTSTVWNQDIKPVAVRRANEAIRTLTLDPAERQGQFKDTPDAVLRAIVRECEWWITAWENEVKVYDHNRVLDQQERGQNGVEAGANPAQPAHQ